MPKSTPMKFPSRSLFALLKLRGTRAIHAAKSAAWPATLFSTTSAFDSAVSSRASQPGKLDSLNGSQPRRGYAQFEPRYLAAAEASPHALITLELDGVITGWSRGAETLFGYHAKEAIGKSILLLVPEEEHQQVRRNLQRIGKGEILEGWRTVRLGSSGKRVHVAIDAALLTDATGRAIGISSMMRDITQQAVAEEKFRLAVESCPNGMVMMDDRNHILMVNGQIERLFGYERHELIGRSIDILLPEVRRAVDEVQRKNHGPGQAAGDTSDGIETIGRRKSGTGFSVELQLNSVDTSEGLLVLAVIVDVTERKQARELFKLAVESCPAGMMMVDGAGCIAMANHEVGRLFGYSREEVIGRPVDLLIPQAARADDARHLAWFGIDPAAGLVGTAHELVGMGKNGTEFPIEVGLNPIRGHYDELMMLCVVRDISERKRAERLKDEFVATVSHELRTPLTSIAASLGLLIGDSSIRMPARIGRLITIAHSNSQRLVRLVSDILDIEKIESGQMAFDFRPVEIQALVEQAIEGSRGLADVNAVAIRLDVPLPGARVNVDSDRLTQALMNLLSNAVKFSPPGSEVVLSIVRVGAAVRISVQDAGPGIPEHFKPRVFQKFAQADGVNSRQMSGTGLGLSIVKQIVTKLNGEVRFADGPGGGTVFTVDLPEWRQASDKVQSGGCDDAIRCAS